MDDFGTNSLAHSSFQSYPPGMSLFQYFVVKLNSILTKNLFEESYLYVSYQIFFISFFMPFLKGLKWKKPLVILVSAVTVFLTPLFLYSDVYTKIYIDPFLGILSGTGMAMIFLHEKKDRLYDINILFTIMMLVLAKDAGLLFAVILAFMYIVDWMISNRKILLKNKGTTALHVLLPLAAVLLPKILWKINISINHAKVSFAGKVDFQNLLNVILRKDYTYKRTVWTNFYRAVLTTKVAIGNTQIAINYVCLFFLILILVYFLIIGYRHKDTKYQVRGKLLLSILCIQTFIYVVGLCITYMYNFSEYEATNLASFVRYMNIVFLAVWVVLILLAVSFIQNKEGEWQMIMAAVLWGLILTVSPLESVYALVEREHVYTSVYIRSEYNELIEKIEKVDENSNIYIISQESSGFDFWVLRYGIRPRTVNDGAGWSIGEKFYEGDIWTYEKTPDEWQEELFEKYDYVALYNINDYFIENYAVLFERKEDIKANELFFVNRETKLLERCQ